MRSRWPTLFAVFLATLVVLGITSVVRLRMERQRRLDAWQFFGSQEARLNRPVKLSFRRPVILREWLQEWSRQSGIHYQFRDPSDERFYAQPLDLRLPAATAKEALQAVASQNRFGWELGTDGRVTIYPDEIHVPHRVQVYALPGELAAEEADQFLRTIARAAANRNWSPNQSVARGSAMGSAASEGFLIPSPGAVTVVNRYDVQLQFAACLEELTAACNASGDLVGRPWSPSDPTWQPRPIQENPAAMQRLLEKLNQQVSFDISDMPLREFADKLETILRVPVLTKAAQASSKIDCRAQHAPLSEVLRRASQEENGFHRPLHYHALANGSAFQILLVTDRRELQPPITIAYQVGDLVAGNSSGENLERLKLVVENIVGEGYWDDVGSFDALTTGNLLVVTHSLPVHADIQKLLNDLRLARQGNVRGVSRLESMLQQPSKLHYDDVTLPKLVKEMRERWHLPVRVHPSSKDNISPGWFPLHCRLPEQPLGHNLRTVLRAMSLDLMIAGDEIEIGSVEHCEQARETVTEIFDLRGWSAINSHSSRGINELIQAVQISTLNGYDRARAAWFDGMLIVHGDAETLARARKFIELATSELPPDSTALDQPRILHPHEVVRQTATRKLNESSGLSYQKQKRLDAILALASHHGLPLVLRQWDSLTEPLQELIDFEGKDRSLRESLVELTGFECEILSNGVVTFLNPGNQRVEECAYLYEIGDLLHAHGGGLTSAELLAKVKTELASGSLGNRRDYEIVVALGRFLVVYIRPEDLTYVSSALAKLRRERDAFQSGAP